jgi:tetratricopeptide (TPR) repeat protein
MEFLRQGIIVSACLTIAAGVASPAGALTQQQIDWCVNSDSLSADLSIGGCTAAFQSGRWSGKDLARAFEHRCWTYPKKTETDWAIADCSEAIHLDTNIFVLYVARGRTYESKGDYDRAIADFNEAIRLNPNYAAA